MRPMILLAALLAGASAAVPARAADLGTVEGRWPTGDLEEVRVEFPVGELIVEATDETELRAQLGVECRRGRESCIERSKRLKLVTHVAGRTRHLKLEGMPKFGSHGLEVTLVISVPRSLAAEIEMGVGSLRVEGMTRDVRVELGVGDVNVLMRESDVNSVSLTVGVGDAKLRHPGHAQAVSGLLGRKVRWSDGTGPARVSVDLGVGDIDVRLD